MTNGKHIVWVYDFEDGTRLSLLDMGLSTEEIWQLKAIHAIHGRGSVKVSNYEVYLDCAVQV